MEADPKPTSPGVTRQIHPDLPKDLKNFVGQEKPFGLVLMAHLSSQKLSRLSMVKSKIPTYEAKTSGFFEAVYHAYFNHLPLKLSPDHIWLTILQGVAFHINNNSEVLRSKLVSHEGQKVLEVEFPNFQNTPEEWESAYTMFNTLIKKNIKPEIKDCVRPELSTTGVLQDVVC